ncbi:hypothetical protein GIB67_025050 [Kingdonia uniflora]|uniref:Uncharacterized protein n=1 Tax=Kingdonia uniflora TaxID=39325 RepID=A0A7J7N7T1_9MAGN|nr:hypothetical protein GIB67_025050 [Kingdonia uniflora]
MGSLPPPSPPRPSPPHETPVSDYRVYASFCPRELTPNTNMSNSIECYDPSNNTWSFVGSIPSLSENHVLKGFAMVAIGESVYIIGGRLCQKEVGHGSDDVIDVDLEVLPTVLRYDVSTNVWSNCAPLSIPRFDFACTVCDNKIYVAGGQCTLGSARGISSAEMYDPTIDEWTSLPNMCTLRYKCVGVTWQGKIHVVGGFAERERKTDSDRMFPYTMERSSAELFNTCRGEWELMVGMWQLDVPPNQIVAVGDRLFSSGDCLNSWKGHIEAYNGKLNIWNIVNGSHSQTLSSPISMLDATEEYSPPIQRQYLTMAPIGTHLYFLAGYRIPGEFNRSLSVVHMFDTSATVDGWRSFEPIQDQGEKELCSHCCVVQVS